MLTHANILANVEAARATLPIAVGEQLLSLLPLSHMMEQTAGLLSALKPGQRSTTPPAADPAPSWPPSSATASGC